MFKVMATNSVMIGLANVKESETQVSKSAYGAAAAGIGVIGAPIASVGLSITENLRDNLTTTAKVSIVAATVPLSLLLSPVTTPIVTVLLVKKY